VSRIVVSGSLPGGESFAFGFWLNGAVSSQVDAQDDVTRIATHMNTHIFSPVRLMLAADSSLEAVNLYAYTTTDPAATFTGEEPLGLAGTSTGASLPLQVATVISLRTAVAGRQNRGRLYLPVNAYDLTAHQFVDAQVDALALAFADLFGAINGDANITGDVCVVSSVGAGHSTPVSSVIVDSRLDVQRRRAASEVALFSTTEAV
jgi:hypothetical protein